MNATSLAFRTVEAATMPLSVHPVSLADAELLLALCEEHAQHSVLERQGDAHAAPARAASLLEFHEALFEPPLRAWAWLARVGDEVAGYAAATVGFSMLERGYSLHLDALYVREPWPAQEIEAALFAQVRDMAELLGCVQLQWHAPAWNAAVRRFDADALRQECVRYALPLPADAD